MIEWLGSHTFPEHRRYELLARLVWSAGSDDPRVLAAVVAERAARPCQVMVAAPVSERVAVLGDDGRYHLLVDGRYRCMALARGRRTLRPHGSALPHEQNCSWWTSDGKIYRVNPPPGESFERGRQGSVTVRWAVLPTRERTDPALVPVRQRCRTGTNWHDWPPYRGSVLGSIVHVLAEAFGPSCQMCGSGLGLYVDHDKQTQLVRGLACHHCNTWVDTCPHPSGCRWAEYLNNPPAVPLGLLYPSAALSRKPDSRQPGLARLRRCALAEARCGAPTKNGTPCRNLRASWPFGGITLWACVAHLDPDVRAALSLAQARMRDDAAGWIEVPDTWRNCLPAPSAYCQATAPITTFTACACPSRP
ncbi:endonuclease domain-containing protein [Nonomuraea sp. NPDC004702]